MNLSTKILLGALALAVGLAGCSKSNEASDKQAPVGSATGPKKELVVGVTPGDFGDMVTDSIAGILEKKGYKVSVKEIADYVIPNKALSEGELDFNVFQHKPYLETFAADNKLDLTPIFQVPTAPLGIYAGRLTKLEDVKDGTTVSAANDPSNFARALVMLEDLGWIKLKDGVNPLTASEKDIAENPKHIKLMPVEAAQLPNTRKDVDFAVINGNFATASGMKITEALFQEPSYAYVNWGVIRTKDINEQWVKDVIEAYNSDEFKAYAAKRFPGYKNPANWSESKDNVSEEVATSESK